MSNLESNEYSQEFQEWLKRNDPAPAQSVEIMMAVWPRCQTDTTCALCGAGAPDEGPPVILHRNRTELFAVDADGALDAVCVNCAEWHAPELVAEWWKLREQEIGEEKAAWAKLIRICVRFDPTDTSGSLCAVCGGSADLIAGPKLFFEGTDSLICTNCGAGRAPELTKICVLDIELATGLKELATPED